MLSSIDLPPGMGLLLWQIGPGTQPAWVETALNLGSAQTNWALAQREKVLAWNLIRVIILDCKKEVTATGLATCIADTLRKSTTLGP